MARRLDDSQKSTGSIPVRPTQNKSHTPAKAGVSLLGDTMDDKFFKGWFVFVALLNLAWIAFLIWLGVTLANHFT